MCCMSTPLLGLAITNREQGTTCVPSLTYVPESINAYLCTRGYQVCTIAYMCTRIYNARTGLYQCLSVYQRVLRTNADLCTRRQQVCTIAYLCTRVEPDGYTDEEEDNGDRVEDVPRVHEVNRQLLVHFLWL